MYAFPGATLKNTIKKEKKTYDQREDSTNDDNMFKRNTLAFSTKQSRYFFK